MHAAILIMAVTLLGGEKWMGEKFPPPKPTVMVFWHAGWCKWCPKMYDDVDRLIKEGWPVSYANVDEYPDIAKKWNFASVPTCITLTEDGVEYQRVVGYTDYATLLKMLTDDNAVRGPPGKPPVHQDFKGNCCPGGKCQGGYCPIRGW